MTGNSTVSITCLGWQHTQLWTIAPSWGQRTLQGDSIPSEWQKHLCQGYHGLVSNYWIFQTFFAIISVYIYINTDTIVQNIRIVQLLDLLITIHTYIYIYIYHFGASHSCYRGRFRSGECVCQVISIIYQIAYISMSNHLKTWCNSMPTSFLQQFKILCGIMNSIRVHYNSISTIKL